MKRFCKKLTFFCLFFCITLNTQAESTYIAPSVEDYIRTCKGAFDCLKKVSPKLLQLGKDVDKILSFYTKLAREASDKKGKFTLGSYKLQLAYIAFKKVIKACELGNLNLIGPNAIRNGRHNEFSSILGVNSDLMIAYEKFAESNSEYLRFGNSLYSQNPNCPGESGRVNTPSTSMTMIPESLKTKADEISLKALNKYLKPHQLKPSQVFEDSNRFRAGVTHIYDTDNKHNNWTTHVSVDPKGDFDQKFNAYVPAPVITLHELCHVENTLPGEPMTKTTSHSSSISETPCVINQIILQDEIYKKINGIPIKTVVDYPNHTQSKDGTLNPGLIANTFRKLKNKNKENIFKALMSKKGQTFVRKHFKTKPKCIKQEGPSRQVDKNEDKNLDKFLEENINQ